MAAKMIENHKLGKDVLLTKLADLDSRMEKLEARYDSITIREVMRILERHICLASTLSKTKFKKFYNIDKINKSNDTDLQARFQAEKLRIGLSNAHINMLDYLKHCGDLSAHHYLTFDEWTDVIQLPIDPEIDDSETADENKVRRELLLALSRYILVELDGGKWKIEDPCYTPRQ
jgi:hypothetical protein